MSTAWLELDDHRVAAQRGVDVVRLTLSLRCTADSRTSAEVPYDMRGEISLESARSSPRYITTFRTARPFWFRDGRRAAVTAFADVTPRQIEAIEDLRVGGNIILQADFTVWALLPDGMARDAALEGHQSRLHIDSAMWADTLVQAGIAEHLLLVVSTPPPSADRTVIEAWNSWQRARDAVIGGRWSDAVGTSRKVAELLGYKKEPQANAIDRTKSERWHSLGYAFFRLTSAPVHGDQVTIDMEWTRQDAVAAVAVAGALLKAALP